MKKHDLTNTHLHRKSPGKALYAAFVGVTMAAMLCQPVFAATVWEKANEIMKDVYNQILLISTIAAIVTASVALMLMNFSRSGRTVDESRAWLKRIIITWAILNGLGFIMSYVTPFFTDGRWNGEHLATRLRKEWCYGHIRWHCSMDRGTGHVRS